MQDCMTRKNKKMCYCMKMYKLGDKIKKQYA